MKSRKLTIALFVLYLLALAGIILFKTKMSFAFLHYRFTFVMDVERSINLIPFGAMLKLNGLPSYHEILYNALVFVPFGIFAGMLGTKKSFVRLLVPIAVTSLFFEAAQYVFALGASDITDILANTIGGAAGIGLSFVLQRVLKEKVYQVLNGIAMISEILFALLIGAILCF